MSTRRRAVLVNEGQLEKALRKFKKKIADSGLLMDLRQREHYVKPTTRRKAAKSLARQRWQRYKNSQQLPPKLF